MDEEHEHDEGRSHEVAHDVVPGEGVAEQDAEEAGRAPRDVGELEQLDREARRGGQCEDDERPRARPRHDEDEAEQRRVRRVPQALVPECEAQGEHP